jgi:hypothetical protein
MREARLKLRSHAISGAAGGDAKPARKSLAAQLLGALLEWRQREADRVIHRYEFLAGQPGDYCQLFEAALAQPTSVSSAGHQHAPRTGAMVEDCA